MGKRDSIRIVTLAFAMVSFLSVTGCASQRATNKKLAELEQDNKVLHQQITQIQSQLREKGLTERHFAFMAVPNAGGDAAAAPDSVEGKLRAEGRTWERTDGPPVIGECVEDTLEGRLNQPAGRGTIGRVLATAPNNDGHPCATVDFGRGCVEGIMFSELSPIRFVAPESR